MQPPDPDTDIEFKKTASVKAADPQTGSLHLNQVQSGLISVFIHF